MFVGGKPSLSNVRVMQIFYEVKQQFPAIPDHMIISLVTSYVQNNYPISDLIDLLKQACVAEQQMGRPFHHLDTPPFVLPPTVENHRKLPKMDDSATGDVVSSTSESFAKRPNTLNINSKTDRRLQLSEKCKDVFKLLNSPTLSDKPPRSPLSVKRLSKQSPTTSKEPVKTASTPTQTTDTLVNNCLSPSVNLSLNVNCQVVQSPTKPKCTAKVDVTPTQPWLSPSPWLCPSDQISPRSFTSVNLTLRPPSSAPQQPIDITSQNSNLTYSTSSFDPQRGLQSRLQITVGPGGTGSVSSVRARPRSSYLPGESTGDVVPARAGSLNNLAAVNPEPPVLLKQQARIERMQIELRTGYARLLIMRQEVEDLEKKNIEIERAISPEMEKQLRLEIKHLRFQCEQLALADKEEFYNNIYTGPSLTLRPSRPAPPPPREPQVIRRQARGRLYYQGPPALDLPDIEGPKWNCSLCTFLNHPDLDKCEQCDMPRVLHGITTSATNLNVSLEALRNPPNTTDALKGQTFGSMPALNSNAVGNAGELSMHRVSDPNVMLDLLKRSAQYLRKHSHNNNNIILPNTGAVSNDLFKGLSRSNNNPITSSASSPSMLANILNANSSEA